MGTGGSAAYEERKYLLLQSRVSEPRCSDLTMQIELSVSQPEQRSGMTGRVSTFFSAISVPRDIAAFATENPICAAGSEKKFPFMFCGTHDG